MQIRLEKNSEGRFLALSPDALGVGEDYFTAIAVAVAFKHFKDNPDEILVVNGKTFSFRELCEMDERDDGEETALLLEGDNS